MAPLGSGWPARASKMRRGMNLTPVEEQGTVNMSVGAKRELSCQVCVRAFTNKCFHCQATVPASDLQTRRKEDALPFLVKGWGLAMSSVVPDVWVAITAIAATVANAITASTGATCTYMTSSGYAGLSHGTHGAVHVGQKCAGQRDLKDSPVGMETSPPFLRKLSVFSHDRNTF